MMIFSKKEEKIEKRGNAKRRMAVFNAKKCKPSQYDPGTMVYKLAEELKQFMDE